MQAGQVKPVRTMQEELVLHEVELVVVVDLVVEAAALSPLRRRAQVSAAPH